MTKRLLGEAVDVPKLAYTSGCISTLAEMYGTPADTPAGGQGRTGLLRDWAAGSRPCVVYRKDSPAWKLRQELLLPKLELRRVVVKMGMDKLALDTLDARVAGCCHAGDDQQFDGIATVARRPRENAVIFGLDAYLVTISAMYSGADLDVKSTRIKLVGLAIGHFMQCLFYCNPLIFLSGCCKCTPYDDKTGVQSRGSLLKMGYPYNYEPLNFIRAAGALQRRLLHCGACIVLPRAASRCAVLALHLIWRLHALAVVHVSSCCCVGMAYRLTDCLTDYLTDSLCAQALASAGYSHSFRWLRWRPACKRRAAQARSCYLIIRSTQEGARKSTPTASRFRT